MRVSGWVETPLEQVDSDLVRRLYAYWRGLCAEGIPSWAQVDPADFAFALPLVFVTAIEWQPFRVKYRLVGTVASAFHGNVTGQYLHEIKDWSKAKRTAIADAYRLSAEERRATFWRESARDRQDGEHTFFAAVLPLAPEGGEVDRCLAIEDYGGVSPESFLDLHPERDA